jgi:hypothetical protein
MYNYFDWCEAGYQLGRLRENWNTTPFRLFISQRDKIQVDNLFRLLYGKLKNKLFDVDELESFFSQLANISHEIDRVISQLSDDASQQ